MTDLNKKIKSLILNREKYLERRAVGSIAGTLGHLSKCWLDKAYRFRKKAVRQLVEKSNFTERMTDELLDTLFRELTQANLLKLLKAEFKDPLVLDQFRKDTLTDKWQRACGPSVITHIFSGNVPNPSIISFILGMLIKSVNIGKVSSKDQGFLDIYLDSLKDFDKKLAATNYVLESHVGAQHAAPLLTCIRQSDLVVAYGNNESIKEIRNQIPVTTPFIGYGHRMSFGIYMKEVLNKKNLQRFAKNTAHDIWMMDQRGCLSPIEIFIESGGGTTLNEFSITLTEALEKLFGLKAWRMPARLGTTHTVGFGGRKMVRLRSVKNFNNISTILTPFQKCLQAVSLEADLRRRQKIAHQLSKMGVNRICRAGQMQRPPITWHHDGKFNLASWINWTDLET